MNGAALLILGVIVVAWIIAEAWFFTDDDEWDREHLTWDDEDR